MEEHHNPHHHLILRTINCLILAHRVYTLIHPQQTIINRFLNRLPLLLKVILIHILLRFLIHQVLPPPKVALLLEFDHQLLLRHFLEVINVVPIHLAVQNQGQQMHLGLHHFLL